MKAIALSIEQMKHLQELGVDTSGASMSWMVYKDITDKWIKEERPLRSHFKHEEKSSPIICLELGYSKGALYSDLSESSSYTCCDIIPAFTLQDILELLPLNIREYKLQSDLHGYIAYTEYIASDDEEDGTNRYIVEQDILHAVCCNELLISAYQMLCWCAENGYLNTNNK